MTDSPANYEDLREQIRYERARKRLRRLQHESRVEEMYFGFTGNSFGDFVDPSDAFRDPDLRGFSSPFIPAGAGRLDHEHGRNRPFVWHDIDLDWMRSQSRWIGTRNPLGIGVLDCLADYTVRTGFDYEARPAKRLLQDATALELAAQVQEVVDEFRSLNTLGERTDEQYTWADRERECVTRSVRDGDVFVRSFDQGDGSTLVRFVEPEQVRQPLGSPADWTFGVHNDEGDIERVLGYAVAYGHPDDWEEVPADQVSHLKLNVDSCVKRGLSDFFATGQALDETWKLLRNLRVVGCIQAAIPWIEQFEGMSGTQLQSYVEAKRDSNRPQIANPITGRQSNYRRYEPGEIPHVTKGRTYLDQPSASNVPNHVAVVQAGLRSCGARWRMPEYMISADASNANYSSTLVAGSPFVVRIECRQATYGRFFLRVIWSAIRNAARYGRFRVGGRVFAWQEVSRYIDLVPTPPQVAIANQGEQARIDHQDIAAGVMSLQTRRARRGLDDEQERRNLQEEPPTRIPGQATDLDPKGNPTKPGDQGGGFSEEQLPTIADLQEAVKREKGEVWQGPSGRWFTVNQSGRVVPARAPQGKGAEKPREKPKKADPAEIKGRIQQMRQSGKISAEDARELAGQLVQLTVAQITSLKKELGLKASGVKAELARKVAERALAAAGVKTTPKPAPAPAPKETPAVTHDQVTQAAAELVDSKDLRVPIPQLRQKLGLSPEAFDRTLIDMHREGKIRLIPAADRSRFSSEQLKQGIEGANETFVTAELPDEYWAKNPQASVHYTVTRSIQASPNAPVTMGDLRRQSSLSKADFDREVWAMIDKGNVYPVRHNHPGSLTPEEREQMLVDSEGGHYFGLAARDPAALGGGR